MTENGWELKVGGAMTLAGRIMNRVMTSAVAAGVVSAALAAWSLPSAGAAPEPGLMLASVASVATVPDLPPAAAAPVLYGPAVTAPASCVPHLALSDMMPETLRADMVPARAEKAPAASLAEAAPPDTAALSALGRKLDEYVQAILPLPVSEQEAECDFLISSCRDSLTRQYVALRLWRSYYSSKIMGVEAVALHVFDRWFASGEMKMPDEVEMMNARIFAGFNRRSLVGMKAEQLLLRSMDGSRVSLFGADSSGVAETGRGRLRILYFYDTGCANCLATTVLLRSLLQEGDYPADLYAVYSGADSLAWCRYAGERFGISAGNVRVFHLWDPDLESDFQRKYGVLQTPMLFLVGCDRRIIGRRLDAQALGVLLDGAVANLEYEYGGEESEAMLDALFGTIVADGIAGAVVAAGDVRDAGSAGADGVAGDAGADGVAGAAGVAGDAGAAGDTVAGGIQRGRISAGTAEAEVKAVIDTIAARAGADSVLYAHVMGDLLYYLSVRSEGCFKNATKYLIDRYISPKSQLWSALGDSLEVMGYAAAMDELLSRALPGSEVPRIFVTGRMAGRSTARIRRWNLHRLPGRETCVVFYSRGCSRCRETLAAADEAALRGRRILLVDMDDNMPSAASGDVAVSPPMSAEAASPAASAMVVSGDVAASTAASAAATDAAGADRPSGGSVLLDTFDLTSLPYIIRLSGRGTVLERYLDAEAL